MPNINFPINKAALSAACDAAGMSDGAKQALTGYYATVTKEYVRITSQAEKPEPVMLASAPVTTATDGATAVEVKA